MENAWSSFVETKLRSWGRVEPDRVAVVQHELKVLGEWFCAPDLQLRFDDPLPLNSDEIGYHLENLFSPKEFFIDHEGIVSRVGFDQLRGVGLAEPEFIVQLPDSTLNLTAGNSGSWVAYWDWISQSSPPEALLVAWLEWELHGEVLQSGPLEVELKVFSSWPSGYFAVFRKDFVPELLNYHQVSTAKRNTPSFLKKAADWRSANELGLSQTPNTASGDHLQRLPMLPFTLRDFENSAFVWPLGVDNVTIALKKTREDGPRLGTEETKVSETTIMEQPTTEQALVSIVSGRSGVVILVTILAVAVWLWLDLVRCVPVLDIFQEFK